LRASRRRDVGLEPSITKRLSSRILDRFQFFLRRDAGGNAGKVEEKKLAAARRLSVAFKGS
jgi:hypothetical protein